MGTPVKKDRVENKMMRTLIDLLVHHCYSLIKNILNNEGPMKSFVRMVFCFLFFMHNAYAVPKHNYDPLLVVVLMVKNEETVMRATLQPYVDAGINSYFAQSY